MGRNRQLASNWQMISDPHDLDVGQPMLKEMPAACKFKSYVGLKGTETKLRK